ncbi:sialidase family protein [uncultured Draconibacterium sp.]|uniref:sialidase family protein n=1 Tax=uncultured Draconibacterium sp. TaxID=1573823 RepID=UPI00326194E1
MKLYFSILFGFLWALGYGQTAQETTVEKGLHFTRLFRADPHEGVSCYRIPALATATNGDVIAAIDERVPSCGDLKWSKDINIVIRRSTDNGNTWLATERVVDYPFGQSASDPSLLVDKTTGEIFLFFNYMDLAHEKDVYYLKVTRSTDNGKTWSEPEDITSQITKPGWHTDFKFITSGRGFQTRSGKLLHTVVNLQKGLFIFESNNHGKSWQLIETPLKPADESKIVELSDGSWMVNSRVNKAGMRFIHRSGDEGKTWISTADSSLIDPGCNASLIRYNSEVDGDSTEILLFAHANHKTERKNLTVRISYDEGVSWSEGKTIYEGSAAYSSMTVLANGDIGLIFEKDDYSDNVFVRVSLNWLRGKKTSVEKVD